MLVGHLKLFPYIRVSGKKQATILEVTKSILISISIQFSHSAVAFFCCLFLLNICWLRIKFCPPCACCLTIRLTHDDTSSSAKHFAQEEKLFVCRSKANGREEKKQLDIFSQHTWRLITCRVFSIH